MISAETLSTWCKRSPVFSGRCAKRCELRLRELGGRGRARAQLERYNPIRSVPRHGDSHPVVGNINAEKGTVYGFFVEIARLRKRLRRTLKDVIEPVEHVAPVVEIILERAPDRDVSHHRRNEPRAVM